MTNWYVVMKIWNENDHIKQTLLALKGYFDKIIVLDGAFSYFPYKHSDQYNSYQSTDGTIHTVLSLLQSMPELSFCYAHKPWTTQVEKMNYGIHVCREYWEIKDGDYILFIDGHEIMEGNFSKQREVIEEEAWNIGKIIIYDPINHPPENLKQEWERLKKYHTQWRLLRYHKDLAIINSHWNFNIYQHGELDKNIPDEYGICEYIRLQHRRYDAERIRLRDLWKHTIGPFRFDENEYVKWRTEHRLEDGHVMLP